MDTKKVTKKKFVALIVISEKNSKARNHHAHVFLIKYKFFLLYIISGVVIMKTYSNKKN